jgi:hypothetical protein
MTTCAHAARAGSLNMSIVLQRAYYTMTMLSLSHHALLSSTGTVTASSET